jgi:hypothetical protein
MPVQEDAMQTQVERVLASEAFRNADALRRLFRYLASKSIAGEADELKEYSVGVDALGKPESYDPRQDSVVRIQVGRLRNKLAQYYKGEGKNDPIIFDLPKGHFKLVWESRPDDPVVPLPEVQPKAVEAGFSYFKYSVIIGLVGIWALGSTFAWWREYREAAPLREAWTAELRELWSPFLDSSRPLVLAVSAPLFVGFPGSGYFRDQTLNTWQDAVASPKVKSIQKSLGSPAILERYSYTGLSEGNAMFHLGKLMNLKPLMVSTTRSDQVSWQQMVDNNVVFFGAPRVFGLQEDGIHDLKSTPNELLFPDDYPAMTNAGSIMPDNGDVYALVSHMPGPLGSGDVQAFNSNHSPGTLGAIQWFTNANFARELTKRLRQPGGHLPRYFQVVLKVRYRDAVPTQIAYVTHRELKVERAPISLK